MTMMTEQRVNKPIHKDQLGLFFMLIRLHEIRLAGNLY